MLVGSTTSKVEMRSQATSSRRASASAYSSRTLPLPTCRAASGMNGFLLRDETLEPVEDAVDVRDRRRQVEDVGECRLVELRSDLLVGPGECDEVALLVPGLHCVALHERVCIC